MWRLLKKVLDHLRSLVSRAYRLQSGVRVRKEKFGLLFYSRNGPKLTFVYSGQWIRPDFFSGRFTLSEWLDHERLKARKEMNEDLLKAIETLLSRLVNKGLIIETLGDP